ncbi:toxin of toxin-antitoxin system VapC [Candidatus Vecturithrix granuli]|uniref:Toxin of toxin-antitoxin system VapC n=1 Tax=Vecturithrix granuli TaxID=1499967 RepID=A0A081BZC7_VECG1|nr:toxin of toxin-antitoxin system VapC [Candidatus Vecturithrix granuli]
MGILIDTNILIEAEKERIVLTEKIQGRKDDQGFVSVITASELLHGVWRATNLRIRTKRSAFVEAILKQFPILPIDLQIVRKHAQIWAELKSKGTVIGLHDTWIAATCLVHQHTLATTNVREFNRIQGLQVECW